jgi:hypothetical protein
LVADAVGLAMLQFLEVAKIRAFGIHHVAVKPVIGFDIGDEAGAVLIAVLGTEGAGYAEIGEVRAEEGVAAHEPGFADEKVNENALGDADGLKFPFVLLGEFVEFGGLFATGDFFDDINAVFQGIHARDAFALFGARTRGMSRVPAIGCDLFLCRHDPNVPASPGQARSGFAQAVENKMKNKKMSP